MAVAKVKKIQLIAHLSERDKILKSLEEASLLHVITGQEVVSGEKIAASLKEKAEFIEGKLNKIKFLLRLLSHFYKASTSRIDSFIPPKLEVSKNDFYKVLQTFDLENIYSQMESADVDLSNIDIEQKNIQKNQALLKPLQGIDFNPNIKETEKTFVFIGNLKSSKEQEFIEEIEKNTSLSAWQRLSEHNGFSYLAFFIFKNEADLFRETANRVGFNLNEIPPVKETVAKTLQDSEASRKALEKNKDKLIAKIKNLAKYERKLKISQMFLENQQSKLNIEVTLTHTDHVFVLDGWIKAKDTSLLEKMISSITPEFSLISKGPDPDEEPPVLLENPWYLKPFEAVTALYGMPSYHELDPTPYLAPFFLVFFGLAIGDVVYGAALAIICWLLKKSKRFSANTKNFLTLFIYGGISAIFFGAITGSWLTLDLAALPAPLKSLIVFDPLAQPALFLVITILLGLAQIYFGLILKFVSTARQRSLFTALQADLPPLLLLPGISLLIAKLLGYPLSPSVNQAAIYLSITGSVGVVLFSSVGEKNLLKRIGSGLYHLYGMSSFLGDTISYGRIMALGLATFLIGSAANTIILGNALFQSALLKILLGITILPLIHLLNLAINTIGAFIHPARLQYVEFFSKFFEGGGKRFQPLALKTDKIVIK